MRALLVAISILLSGCVTPPLQVTGRYATSLSDADVQQIKQLVAAHPDLGRSLRTIEAVRRDRARVEAGRYSGSGWLGTSFFVVRRGETWHIDEHSQFEATAERTITVY